MKRSVEILILMLLSCIGFAADDFKSVLGEVDRRPPFAKAGKEPMSLSFVQLDAANPWRYGILQIMEVNASMERVVAVVDDVNSYSEIFRGITQVEIKEAKSRDDFILFTEVAIPLPFVANDRTNVHYRVERKKDFVKYRYSLVSGNHLEAFEGITVIWPVDAGHSIYWELDFIEPGYGSSRALPATNFWRQNALGNVQSDWAIKLRAEMPKESKENVRKASEEFAEKFFDQVIAAFSSPLSHADLLAMITPTKPTTAAEKKSPSGPKSSTAKPKQSGPKREPKP
jgi:hypothetical protein